MTPLRRTIARRLVEAQQTAAILTTFNEIDMSAVMALREAYQDRFVKQHGMKLGFMSFFVKAVIEALKAFPAVNAEVRGTDIVYKDYYDIGVAVGGGKGLVVPVLRDAERMSFAEVEKTIADFGGARAGQQAAADRADRGHVHDLERRRLRLDDVDADPEPAPKRDPGPARHPEARGGRRRRRSRSAR